MERKQFQRFTNYVDTKTTTKIYKKYEISKK